MSKSQSKSTVSIASIPEIVQGVLDEVSLDEFNDKLGHLVPDLDERASAAAEFCYRGVFMNLVWSSRRSVEQRRKKADDAQRQYARAIARDSGPNRNQQSQDKVEQATAWAAQAAMQVKFAEHLLAQFEALYQVATGENAATISQGNSAETVKTNENWTADQVAAAELLKGFGS